MDIGSKRCLAYKPRRCFFVAWQYSYSVLSAFELRYYARRDNPQLHPLIALAAFNLDFLCIHPFAGPHGYWTSRQWDLSVKKDMMMPIYIILATPL